VKATKLFLDEILQQQRKDGESARIAYQETGDPQIIIKYIKKSKTAAEITESWVLNAIQSWMRNDRHDLLKQAFLPRRGERKNSHQHAIEDMIFAHRIDQHRKKGQTLNEAYILEMQRSGKGALSGKALDKEILSLKNKYRRAKRINMERWVNETPEAYVLVTFPGMMTIKTDGKHIAIFGEISITFPKDGASPTGNFNGLAIDY
jgi:hypothetical protein